MDHTRRGTLDLCPRASALTASMKRWCMVDIDDVNGYLEQTPERQIALFSATMPRAPHSSIGMTPAEIANLSLVVKRQFHRIHEDLPTLLTRERHKITFNTHAGSRRF